MRKGLPEFGSHDFPYYSFLSSQGTSFSAEEYELLVSKCQLASAFRRLLLKRHIAVLFADAATLDAHSPTIQIDAFEGVLDALERERDEMTTHAILARAFNAEMERSVGPQSAERSRCIIDECANAALMAVSMPVAVLARLRQLRPSASSRTFGVTTRGDAFARLLKKAERSVRATIRLAAATREVRSCRSC